MPCGVGYSLNMFDHTEGCRAVLCGVVRCGVVVSSVVR